MTQLQQIDKACNAIARGLRSGVPFLQFGDGEKALRLCYRNAGDEIDDPECDELFQATMTGVFKRCLKVDGTATSFTYLRFCHLDPNEIRAAFKADFEAMSPLELESVPLDAGFQVMQFEAAAAKSRSRQARRDVC